jgi:hypothetical protein
MTLEQAYNNLTRLGIDGPNSGYRKSVILERARDGETVHEPVGADYVTVTYDGEYHVVEGWEP